MTQLARDTGFWRAPLGKKSLYLSLSGNMEWADIICFLTSLWGFFSFLVGRHPLLSRGVASIFSTLSVGFMWNNPAIRIHTSSNTHTVCRIKATELLKFRQHHLPPLQAYPSGCYVDPGRCAQVFHSLMTARPEWSLSLLRDFLWCEGGMSSCCRKLSVEVISTVQGNDCCLLKCHQMDWH